MAWYDDEKLWQMAPGLFSAGVNWYAGNQKADQERKLLEGAKGPLDAQLQGMQGAALSQAQTTDPNALAADRFAQWNALYNPEAKKVEVDTVRDEFAKGRSGLSSYNLGLQGVPAGTMAANPRLAAMYAGQESARAKAAYQSMDEGQKYVNNLVSRAGSLGQQRQQNFSTGQSQMPKTQGNNFASILSGLAGNKDVMNGLFGALKGFVGSGAPSPMQQLAAQSNGSWDVLTAAQPSGWDFGPGNMPPAPDPFVRFDDWSGGDYSYNWGSDWNLGEGWGW